MSWSQFAAAMPEMAAAGLRLLYQYGPGLGFLATVRRDGGPRLHPVCPHVVDDDLWLFVVPRSPKRHDLERDGRYAVHAFPPADTDDEFAVIGRAQRIDDLDTVERVRAGFVSTTQPDELLFRLTVERALLAVYAGRGVFPPTYTRWSATT